MAKEKLTSGQLIALITTFIFGSSVIVGLSTDANQDSWISIILAVFIASPVALVYARIIKLNPGEGLFDIVEKLFGAIISKIIIILMTWYALHLGALVLRNFSEYIEITTLFNTPQILVMIMLLSIALYLGRSGTQILGKWSLMVLGIIIMLVFLTLISSLSNINFSYITPIMEASIKDIAIGGYNIFSFPFAETVLLLPLACSFKKEYNPYKIYTVSIIIGASVLLIIFLRNLTVLGEPMMTSSPFPSYVAARIIELGSFITRIEGVVTINLILSGITKITVCLIAVAKGAAKLLGSKKYNNYLSPSTLLMLALSAILYTNAMEMFAFIEIYGVYAIPFQLIIPLIVWIASEKKARKNKIPA